MIQGKSQFYLKKVKMIKDDLKKIKVPFFNNFFNMLKPEDAQTYTLYNNYFQSNGIIFWLYTTFDKKKT